MASTMNLGVHRVAADPTWRTPGKVFAALDAEFDFTLDPCASSPIKPGIDWFSQSDNGLWMTWPFGSRVFVNPPYGRAIADWMRKITLERDRCEVIVALIPARTDTEWWHENVMRASEVGTGMTENELKHYVLRVARLNGWSVFHMAQSRPSRPVRIQGDATSAGYPDLTLARDKEVLWIELKTDDGMLRPEQYAWQLALPAYHVIRPRDIDAGRLVELLG